MTIKKFEDFRICKNWESREKEYSQEMNFKNTSYDSISKVVTTTVEFYFYKNGDLNNGTVSVYVVDQRDVKIQSTSTIVVDTSKSLAKIDCDLKKQYSFYVGDAEKLELYMCANLQDFRIDFLDLTIPNISPVISDSDKNLGDKNEPFAVTYQVNDQDNDTLTIVEKLNGNILRTINNAPKNENLTINFTNEQLYTLPLNQENKISIEVNDGKGGINYRNYIFRRTNTPPIIGNSDKDLGIINSIQEKYKITDIEGNIVSVIEKLDSNILRTFNVDPDKEYVATIDKDTWIRLKNGQHKYSIEATDFNNAKTIRTFTFSKKETKISFTLAKPFTTDIKATKILITPSWEITGATAKVEACNNAFDVNATWEDITKQVLINRHYNFTNATKTAEKWGINIRFTIEKYPSATNEVCIKGFGGAFE